MSTETTETGSCLTTCSCSPQERAQALAKLVDLVDAGTIRILDLVVRRELDGSTPAELPGSITAGRGVHVLGTDQTGGGTLEHGEVEVTVGVQVRDLDGQRRAVQLAADEDEVQDADGPRVHQVDELRQGLAVHAVSGELHDQVVDGTRLGCLGAHVSSSRGPAPTLPAHPVAGARRGHCAVPAACGASPRGDETGWTWRRPAAVSGSADPSRPARRAAAPARAPWSRPRSPARPGCSCPGRPRRAGR